MKILIAEDDVVSRKVLAGHLEKWGYDVTETSNGAAALSAFESGDYSMAVLDWMMPEMDGVDLVRHIRRARRMQHVYLILLTARAQIPDLVAGLEAGADDYVTKPFDREELRARVLAGRRIVELQAALLRSEKSASVGQVALGLAQEFSEPLSRLRDNLIVLRRDALDLAEHAGIPGSSSVRTADSMSVSFARSLELITPLLNTVRNLRDFAGTDEFIMKPLVVSDIIMDVVSMVQRLAESKAVEVRVDLAEVPAVNGNAGKLKKVLLHLLVNAFDAVERRGTIILSAAADADQVVIEVEDNGRGIDPAQLRHIFEPFYALHHPADRRPGLGMSISDAIIREHGGTLNVESEVGRGTTFTIRLPLQGPEAAARAAIAAPVNDDKAVGAM